MIPQINILNTPSYLISEKRLLDYFSTLETSQSQGYTINQNGDIFIQSLNMDGTHMFTLPTSATQRPTKYRLEKAKANDQLNPYSPENMGIRTKYGATRLAIPKENGAKYLFPRKKDINGFFCGFSSTVGFSKKFNESQKVESLHLFEGKFKADFADLNGINAVAFSGISVFELTADLKEAILRCSIDNLVLCYDGDCKDLAKDPFKPYTTQRGKKVVSCANQRPRNFYSSARNFAQQLYDWIEQVNEGKDKSEKIKVKLIYCHSQEGQEKALDDMVLASTNDEKEKEKIFDAFKSQKSNEYFNFFTLPKTRFELRLLKFFGLNSVRDFYQLHKDTLQDKKFRFSYKKGCFNTYKFCKLRNCIVTTKTPFSTDFEPFKNFKCKEYIGEHKEQIFDLFNNHERIFLALPTGGGKTTICKQYADYFTQENKTGDVYIVAPTIKLGEQIATDINGQFIYQRQKDFRDKKDIGKQSRIFVCTYDSLPKMLPQKQDVIIIDEAHNLVNQYGFREKALTKLYSYFNEVKKVICLSATPNYLFSKNEGFKLITADIEQRNQVTYIPHLLRDNISIVEAITAELLQTDLTKKTKIDGSNLFNSKDKENIHFVFLNSKNDLKKIRRILIDRKIITIDETTLLTSERQDSEQVFSEIVDFGEIKSGVKIVFTTCLLSEGINIKNRNIGKVIIGNIKCIDTLRQFPARFRNMQDLEVQLFYKQQTKINANYFIPTNIAISDLSINAASQKTILQRHLDEAQKEGFIFEPTSYHAELCPLVYINSNQTVQVDSLRMYYKEYERKINTIPIDDLIAELATFPNTQIKDNTLLPKIDEKLKHELTTIAKTQKEIKNEHKERVLNDLQKDETTTLQALQTFAKEQKKSNIVKEIKKHLPEQQPTQEPQDEKVESYLTQNEDLKDYGTYIEIVKRYLELKEFTDTPIDLLQEIETKKEFNILKKSLQRTRLIQQNANNWQRRKLSPTERTDAKGLKQIQKHITKTFEGKVFTLIDFYIEFRKMTGVKYIDKLGELKTAFLNPSETYMEVLFHSLFKVEKEGDKLYNIQSKTYENYLKSGVLKPPKKGLKKHLKH